MVTFSLHNYLQKFLISMHGLIHLAGPVKKTFWILVTLFTLVGFGINAFSLIGKYTNWDTVVVVDMKHEKELPFPAVTGQLNMYNASAANLETTNVLKQHCHEIAIEN